MPTFDPAASWEVTAVEAFIHGRLLRIPPLPAPRWLTYLMRTSDAMALLPLLEVDPVDELFDQNLATAAEVKAALEDMVGVAAGCTAWVAFCLASTARELWPMTVCKLTSLNVRFDEMPIGMALAVVYASVVERLATAGDGKTLKAFDAWLDSPRIADFSEQQRLGRSLPPLPASAMQYVQKRPKTQPRRPPTLPGETTEPPSPPPPLPDGSDQLPISDSSMPPGDGGGNPLAG